MLNNEFEIVHEEYVRLNNRIDKYVDDAQYDFRLLGLIGPIILSIVTLLGLKDPLKLTSYVDLKLLTFLLFTLIQLIYMILAFRDLVKALMVQNLIMLIADKEKRLNKLIKNIDEHSLSDNFNRTVIWEQYFKNNFEWLTIIIVLILFVMLAVFPVIVMWIFFGYTSYLIAFVIISLTNLGSYVMASYWFIGRYGNKALAGRLP